MEDSDERDQSRPAAEVVGRRLGAKPDEHHDLVGDPDRCGDADRFLAAFAAGGGAVAGSLDERPEMARVYETAINARGAQLVNALRKSSAVNWPDKLPKDVPLLLVHGTADWCVSPTKSIRMASLLLERRVPFRLMLLEGDDHGLTWHPVELRMQTRGWFDRYLKQAVPFPVLEPHGG